jgi:hypothetical protein
MASSSHKPEEEFFLDCSTTDTPQKNLGIELKIKCPSVHSPADSPCSDSSYSDNDDGEEPYDVEDSDEDELSLSTKKSLDILCMSPPGVRIIRNPKTSTRHGKPKKTRLKKNRHLKRPNLINSAANLENKEETSEYT